MCARVCIGCYVLSLNSTYGRAWQWMNFMFCSYMGQHLLAFYAARASRSLLRYTVICTKAHSLEVVAFIYRHAANITKQQTLIEKTADQTLQHPSN